MARMLGGRWVPQGILMVSIIAGLLLFFEPFGPTIPVQAGSAPVDVGEAESQLSRQTAPNEGAGTVHPAGALRVASFLPFLSKQEAQLVACRLTGESYGELDVIAPPTDRPADQHADLNLGLRGYAQTIATQSLVSYNGYSDSSAPQLSGLFSDNRRPAFRTLYRVYDWNWDCNCRGNLITTWPVTLAGLAVTPGELIRVPDSGYSIGSGYEVLVLYASTNRVTLKYTRTDNVVSGYTLQIENICVDPNLLAHYQSWNAAGRGHLPALRPGQAVGRATGNEIGVAIRDTGSFMDPRSRNDWWIGW